MSLAELEGDVVILACGVSAGIHGALVPGHFDEGAGAGLGFVAAAAALAGLVIWLSRRPGSRPAQLAAVTLCAGLIGSYALAVTTGVPVPIISTNVRAFTPTKTPISALPVVPMTRARPLVRSIASYTTGPIDAVSRRTGLVAKFTM